MKRDELEELLDPSLNKLETKAAEDELFKGKVLLGYDFQSWPVFALKFRDILLQLGFEDTEDGFLLRHNKENDKLLDSYPLLFEDDGMAYGINEQYVTDVDNEIYEDAVGENKINVFNIFRDRYHEKEVER